MSAALVLLSACGPGFDNDPFRRGDLVGRVLRGDKSSGRVVLMGAEAKDTNLDDEGRFHFDGVSIGAHELLVVASDAEALQVPVLVAGAQVTDLQDLDPAPAASIVINLTTQGTVADCWVKIHQTDLQEVHAPNGSYRFVVGPLGAGCYDASMENKGSTFWTQTRICLQPGEQQSFDVTW
jgi:hypothetical protein